MGFRNRIVLLILLNLLHHVDSNKDQVDKLLQDYQKDEAPMKDESTEVKIGIYINNMYKISAQDMEYSISYYLRMAWNDKRLSFDEEEVGSSLMVPDGGWNEVWTPDIFMRNEKESSSQSILRPHRLLRIKSQGDIWYVVKMTTTLNCPMKLQKFPFDTQQCAVMLESFRYTMDTLHLAWLDHPVDVDKDVQLPEFTLKDIILRDCSQNYTAGSFPCLEIRFTLSRDIGYYLLQVFIPSCFLVLISWIQFWLSPDAIVARVIIGLFTSFTLVSQMTSLHNSLPKISYITAIDVWTTVCLLFAVCSLVEVALAHYLEQKEKSSKSRRVDVISRILFPALFFVFNIIYWPLYAQ